jgi:hypothetical protein
MLIVVRRDFAPNCRVTAAMIKAGLSDYSINVERIGRSRYCDTQTVEPPGAGNVGLFSYCV